jgi:DNA adenine methylase
VPQPFPYQGSKRRLASLIVSHFGADVRRLIEPFAGSAAVSLATAARRRSSSFLINDLNAPLVDLWRAILTDPNTLAAAYTSLWERQLGCERAFYDRVRDEFNQSPRPDRLLYLLARCVKASVRYNGQGEFNQSPDNRRRGMHPHTMRLQLLGASRLLAGRTELAAVDYREILDRATAADVVYMDPPYQGVCGQRDPRYLAGVAAPEFVAALGDLVRRGSSFVLSYDGRTGDKIHGRELPAELGLTRLEVDAGRSSQATLLGLTAQTVESIYLSPVLAARAGLSSATLRSGDAPAQLSLFGE